MKKNSKNLIQDVQNQIDSNRKKVDYDTMDFPIEYIYQQFKSKRFYIPNYQRKFIWKLKTRSRFIESIILGLPIPFLFLYRDKREGTLEIVDGAQRIQSIHSYMNNEFELIKLKNLSLLNGFYYKDLPSKARNVFDTTALRMIILEENTTEQSRKEIFHRLNTTAEKANPAEVITGTYDDGEFIEFVKECTEHKLFKKLCPISKGKLARKEDYELIFRFFAYSDNYLNYDSKVKDFIENFVKEHKDNFDKCRMKTEFNNMLEFVDKYFPYGFRKTKGSNSTPRTRFEAISIGVNLALRKKPNLSPLNVDWIDSKKFNEVTTTDAANNKNKLKERIEFVKNKLLKGVM